MTLRTDDGETTGLFHFGRQLDIGTTTCHVGGNRYNTCPTGLRNNLCLLLVQLGVEDIMLDLTKRQHTTQELGDLYTRRTDQYRTTLVHHLHDLVNDRVVFLTLGAVDTVVHIVTRDRLVGRDHNDIQFVDIPELTCLGLSRTGHTGEFVIHTEIVLQRDRGKGLGSALDLYVLFRLHCLVQTIGPTTTFHNTACLLVHDLHLTAVDDIIDIFLEEGVGLEQLVYGMYALRLNAVVGQDIVLALLLFFGSQTCLTFQLRHFGAYVRQHEEVRVVGRTGEGIDTLVGQLDGLVLLVNNEIELVGRDMHVLLVLLEVELLGLLEAHLDTGFREVLNERLRFRHSFERTEERQFTFFAHFLVLRPHLCLGLSEQLGRQGRLLAHKVRYAVFVLIEHLILTTRHRTGDNQRRTGIIDQDGVHLIDDREVMTTLNEIQRADRHVITQVVKTELIVRTKGNIAGIGLTTLIGIGFIAVNTIDTQAQELIEGTVPLAVTFGEVVINGHYVNTFVREGVEVHRQGSNQGLTFTGRHLGDLTLMQHDTTEELHIIVHHIPCDLITAGHPVVVIDRFLADDLNEVIARIGCEVLIHLGSRHLDRLTLRKTMCRRFDDRKSLRQNLLQYFFVLILDLFL